MKVYALFCRVAGPAGPGQGHSPLPSHPQVTKLFDYYSFHYIYWYITSIAIDDLKILA